VAPTEGEGDTVIRELWDRHMDAKRALSVALGAVAYGLGILALAVTPGFVVSGGTDPGWFAKLAPAVGGASGMAINGYATHHRPGTRSGLRWALAQGGLMLLVILGAFALATAISPIVSPNPTFGGDAWAGLLAVGAVLAGASAVLWERNRRRQRTAAVLLVAVCLVIAGIAGRRAGGPWTPAGTLVLIAGILGVAAAMLQRLSHMVQETADPAI
jgi:peptidoglycan/LPS O-acetylase OafA/YrhL